MKKPFQIGITGGIGSGKSLVCKIFQCLGVPVYEADARAKELLMTNATLIDEIRREFGNQVLDKEGKVDRKYLASAVFGNSAQLEKLNHLVHPRVRNDYALWVDSFDKNQYVIKEAAIIFEAGTAVDLDAVVVVSAGEPLRIKRVMARDPHRNERNIRNIIENQMPEVEMLNRADFVVVNDESRLVIPQVLELHDHFMTMN